jgi:hypothetical protein
MTVVSVFLVMVGDSDPPFINIWPQGDFEGFVAQPTKSLGYIVKVEPHGAPRKACEKAC